VRSLAAALIAGAALWAAPAALAAPAHASAWCGVGESPADLPDATTGPQFHLVYAVSSDGADDFPDVASQMASDAASIDAWWAQQDPTRTLRFDTARFPTCTAVDISFLRLPVPAAALVGNATAAFQTVEAAVAGSPLATAAGQGWKDYLVYYGGPPPQTGVCGTGAGDFGTGQGVAVVWLAGCPTSPIDAVAAHEALHALGALPLGAPHACPNDPAHPCDSALDVLYPYASGQPLSALYLDWNHDDYYAHSGAWDDLQDSPFLHRLDVPQVPLTVAPTGGGSVVSQQPGVVCAAACTSQWDSGAVVDLQPQGSTTKRFIRWSGACSGNGLCQVTLAAPTTVGAVFGPLTIVVHTSVSGGGRILCTPACSTHFPAGDHLRVRAVAKPGWRFVRWSGACTGTKATCTIVSTDASFAVKATFAKLPPKKKQKKR
jgi:Fe-S cluster biogenesis protein NfuA